MACRDYHTLYGRPYTILRYGIPYGPRMRDNCVVAAFMKRCMRGEPLRIDGDGSQQRFFVYVEDLAQAHVKALDDVAVERDVQHRGRGARSASARSPSRCARSSVRASSSSARPGPVTSRPESCRTTRHATQLGWAADDDVHRRPRPHLRVVPGAGRGRGERPRRRRTAASVGSPRSSRCCRLRPAGRHPPHRGRARVQRGADGRAGARQAELFRRRARRRRRRLDRPHPRRDRGVAAGSRSRAGCCRSTRTRACRPRTTSRSPTCAGACATASSSPDDLVFTVDADGQHDLDVIDDLHRRAVDEKLDALLVRRDLSTYPLYKQAGNGVLSAWATLWAGHRLHDVESGYRIFRLGALADALDVLPGLQVLRDRRGRGGAVPARLPRAQRRARAGAGVSQPHAHGRRVHRPRRDSHWPRSGSRRAGRRARTCRASRRRSPSPRAARGDRAGDRSARGPARWLQQRSR